MLHKKSGLQHLCATLFYAFNGFLILTKETAFKHELLFLLFTFIAFYCFDFDFQIYITEFMLWLILVAFEAVNTAIEYIVDKTSPEISDFAKKTKDLASFAVFCMVCVNLVYIITVFSDNHV